MDDARKRQVGAAQVPNRYVWIEAKCAVAIEEAALAGCSCRLDRQKLKLGRDAAVRREATDPAAGSEHTMAWHDDREWVTTEGLPNGARGAACTQHCRNVAIRSRGTWRNCACRLVDSTVKYRNTVHVKPGGGEITFLAAQQRDDTVD